MIKIFEVTYCSMHLKLGQLRINVFLIHIVKVILPTLIIVIQTILIINTIRIKIFTLIKCIIIILLNSLFFCLPLSFFPILSFLISLYREVLVGAVLIRSILVTITFCGLIGRRRCHFLFDLGAILSLVRVFGRILLIKFLSKCVWIALMNHCK